MYVPSEVYYTYDFDFTVHVNSQWFSEIKWRVNPLSVEGAESMDYVNAYKEAEEIKAVLQNLR